MSAADALNQLRQATRVVAWLDAARLAEVEGRTDTALWLRHLATNPPNQPQTAERSQA